MIQRVQSLYLLVAIVLLKVMFFFPVLNLVSNGEIVEVGVCMMNEKLNYMLLIPVIAALLFMAITIFSFKNRMNQVKLCKISSLLTLITVAVIFLGYSSEGAEVAYTVFSVFPLLALVFIQLASRSIIKDENLIRSADRIR